MGPPLPRKIIYQLELGCLFLPLLLDGLPKDVFKCISYIYRNNYRTFYSFCRTSTSLFIRCLWKLSVFKKMSFDNQNGFPIHESRGLYIFEKTWKNKYNSSDSVHCYCNFNCGNYLTWSFFITFESNSTPQTGNNFETTVQNESIEVTAPKYYKCENNSENEIYFTNSVRNTELLFYTYYKKDYANYVNEQYLIDSIIEQLKKEHAFSPVTNEKLLTLDHQAPQFLYAFADGIIVHYIYITCEKFDDYYVLSLYNTSISDWNSTKDEITEIISSVKPKSSM